MPSDTAVGSDLDTLRDLNRDYVRSVQTSDVRRFEEILADDFTCSNPDGSLVDREAFLGQTARPVAISNLETHDVDVRLLGDVAIIHARTSFITPDGQPGRGRYTDVWARRDGKWLAVSAHVTRC
ncbi:MAG TPA: nuclear transport factor 2 family protein [Thermomicrobiales bacterium]|jgi:ketosteroid isomerase-like protein